MISSHMDDFFLAGTDPFLREITKKIADKLEISKLEDDEFRFTGMDVKKKYDAIVVSMEEIGENRD